MLQENSFKVVLDEATVLEGLTGTVFGPVVLVQGERQVPLGGAELERWLEERCCQVRVITPRGGAVRVGGW